MVVGTLLALPALAENDHAGTAAQANNPLANMTAFSLQNYYIGDINDSDETANQFWLRFATPFSLGDSRWLLRTSLPINSYPTAPGGHSETGLGDLNTFASYLFDTGSSKISFGIGPQVTAPTASEDTLGSEQWSAGLVNVLFNAESAKFQYGYLAGWQHSFAGDDDRENVNSATLQPFAYYQLGNGNYLRGAPIWSYNFENDNYSVPLGLGIGHIVRQGKTLYNFTFEPQFSVVEEGPAPDWQVVVGLSMQFLQ
ncbi:hypothetical protein [Halomonas binhaiensis]|nr:hypothetical protein [Halomonas binhaiensis]